MTSSHPILNISSYRFVDLADATELRGPLHGQAQACQLKGTVLLAQEGINFFMAGSAEGITQFLDWLRHDPRFAGLEVKQSWSATTPFKRLKVKVKREIIRMNHPTIRPAAERAPSVSPQQLAAWLAQGHDDAGRPVVTLDTRNAFEVDAGTFDGTIDWRIAKFSEFPAAVDAHLADLQGKTVVSFCTGGIRCEKAAIYLQEAGLDSVYQLEGGILKYFELTNGAPHWRGGCFVFDEREVLGAALEPARA
ncbi:MAG: sulfurtransferase [Burkholderiales bacterium]|nr:sulfurtransferase [Burkholderiales bacterium]